MDEQSPRSHGWIQRLGDRWAVGPGRVIVILLVFACTGTTVLLLKRPVVAYFAGDGERSMLFSLLYYLLILPVYNVLLLLYGALFGQFRFFWAFEKRFFGRLFGRR
ncbi:MAG: prolipoprotein diacylglyceryl transferase [Flavobacteriales bacterium]|nr:prolipoprotein diacylglyceryl transferase [Flavobacteriales bacterium]